MTKDIDRLIDAITDGVAVSRVKDKMLTLEARKNGLERLIAESDEPPALLHPNMAHQHHREIDRLHEALSDDEHRHEAVEIIRGLVDRIVLQPAPDGASETIAIDLEGNREGILSLSAQTKKPSKTDGDFEESIELVAGARNHRYRHLLVAPV